MSDHPLIRATVREVDGQIVLDDPDALAMFDVTRHGNCSAMLEDHGARILHFRRRAIVRGHTAAEVAIIVINADMPGGEEIAAACQLPDGWAEDFRAQGATPFARGLVERASMQEAFDAGAGARYATALREIAGLPVMVFDYGAIALFDLGALPAPADGTWERPFTHDSGDQRQKWCKCQVCAVVSRCEPAFDFYVVGPAGLARPCGVGLTCERCYQSGLRGQGIRTDGLASVPPEPT